MPHIITEYSSDINSTQIESLQSQIQKFMPTIKDGNFALEQCKARNFTFGNYLVGSINQENSSFIHVSIKILEGRSANIKKQLASGAAKITEDFIKEQKLPKSRIDISVDIIDMDKEFYQKIRIGD